MAAPIVPDAPRPGAFSRWSRPVLLVGALVSVVLAWQVGAKSSIGALFTAVLLTKVLDELAAKRSQ